MPCVLSGLAFGAGSRGAHPGRVDSFKREATISPQDETGQNGSGFGSSVALSANGDTALIGGPADATGKPGGTISCTMDPQTGANRCDYEPTPSGPGPGAVWVYARTRHGWSERAKLTAQDVGAVGASEFGASVAISADGRTALIGAPGDAGGAGAAWAFKRSGGRFAEQGAKLTGTGAVAGARFGASVALSADGRIALVGGPGKTAGAEQGAAWPFTRSSPGGLFSAEAELTANGASAGQASAFGSSVALSANGHVALIGGPGDGNGGSGAAWTFTRSSHAGFTPSGAKLTIDDQSTGGASAFGSSVALSGAGDAALIGAPGYKHGHGAAWVFKRSRSMWRQHGNVLTAEHEAGAARFGSAVAMSSDGSTVLIGGPDDGRTINSAIGPDDGSGYVLPGAAWMFAPAGRNHLQEGTKLTAAHAANDAGDGDSQAFGQAVAMASGGRLAMIGGPLEGFNQFSFPSTPLGAAWPFVLRAGRAR